MKNGMRKIVPFDGFIIPVDELEHIYIYILQDMKLVTWDNLILFCHTAWLYLYLSTSYVVALMDF